MQPAILILSLLATIGIVLPHPPTNPRMPHYPAPAAVMQANDNTRPAGKIQNGVLEIRLDATTICHGCF